MKRLSLQEILPSLKGTIIKGNKKLIIKRVVSKPEKVRENTLFFNFNRKADWKLYRFNPSNAIVTNATSNDLQKLPNTTIVRVNNIYQAYWGFVQYYRNLFEIPVIGVTGTCGKTTTTEIIKAILSKKYKTHSNYDGNNAWYLSLPYLLGINDYTQIAVFEMGVGKPGDLRYICKHYQPQVGILLNIGTYHLLGCKTQENYIKAKAELLEGLRYNGTLIINLDDENTKKVDLTHFKGNIIYFGLSNQAHFKAKDIKYGIEGMEFTLIHQNEAYDVFVPGYGEYNVYNALAAIAAVDSVGVEITDAIERLASFKPVRQHMQIRSGINYCKIIDDTWNCTPLSMENALKVLKDISNSKKTVAVLGYMPQLGAAGMKEYYNIGEKVTELGIDFLILIGDETKKIGIKAIETGFDKNNVFFCASAEQLYKTLLPLMGQDTVVLFKFPYKYRLSKDPSYREFMNKILE